MNAGAVVPSCPLRVLHVIPSLGPERGGPGYALPVLAKALARRGVAIDIAATDDNGRARLTVPLNQPVKESGVTNRYFPRQSHFYTFSWPLTAWLFEHAGDYDVIHVHALFNYPAVCAALSARTWSVPYIVRPLGTLNRWGMENRRRRLKYLSYRTIERRIVRGAAAMHYTTEAEQLEAEPLTGGTPGVIVPLPVPLRGEGDVEARDKYFLRHPELRGKRIVLFLSRLDPKKGLDLLLPAFAAGVREDPRLVLIVAGRGTDAFAAQLEHTAARLGVSHAVRFPGFMDGSDKAELLTAADVFVLPSYSENFGIAAVEAMAAGLAVVVSEAVGIARDVETSGAGLVVPPEIEALTRALLSLSSDDSGRRAMGARGRRMVQEQYSPDAVADRMLGLYRCVVS